MNNPLLFTDPSGYMPQYFQDEYDLANRNDGGDPYKNEGGVSGGWNPFGWINQWGHSQGTESVWVTNRTNLYGSFRTMMNSPLGGYWDIAMDKPYLFNSRDLAKITDASRDLSNQTASYDSHFGRSWNRPMVQAKGFENHLFQYDRETGQFFAPWTDIEVDPLTIMYMELYGNNNTFINYRSISTTLNWLNILATNFFNNKKVSDALKIGNQTARKIKTGGHIVTIANLILNTKAHRENQISTGEYWANIAINAYSFIPYIGRLAALEFSAIDLFYPGGITEFSNDYSQTFMNFYNSTGINMRTYWH